MAQIEWSEPWPQRDLALMHPYLNRLGVPLNVQLFFEAFYRTNACGDLCFKYGNQEEVFSFAYHRVPAAIYPWTAGDVFARQLLLASSAMECVAFLAGNSHRFPGLDVQFVALGLSLDLNGLAGLVGGRAVALVFGRDLLGHLLDIKAAAEIRRYPVRLSYAGDGLFTINGHQFAEAQLSLSAFEKASGFRSGIRTYKPKGFPSFLEQLKS